MNTPSAKDLAFVADQARATVRQGEAIGLGYVAASHDIGDVHPMLGPDGRPLAETTFRWIDPKLKYWTERAFALRAQFIHAVRCCAEPFWFAEGRFGSWRPMSALEALDGASISGEYGVAGAIIAPTYLTGGVIGAVVWATPDPAVPVRAIFEREAPRLHAQAMRLLGAYNDAVGEAQPAVRLTRREIQCLKWAAAGKTDSEVGQIMHIAVPTVRFHIRNAATKLKATGRAQATHRAALLGYVGGLNT
ncbi:DNA-binding CsgD family transcriptional regulator [Caulobacter ginsengisoli]|uniref:DNA-binding CsgD family transcriptional regulator n=1 Tax=Caulobacter ginsengisoli TaxID=400775 RepID=A0ABU0IWW4_9CAUL|nr:helix-turn-helix transcriptional regulator [Caulobacter ginsengisoli]MDQ0465826.1 DNA-binding CsgD family transcriptional regulator [Caulobacter ginsengisoli]